MSLHDPGLGWALRCPDDKIRSYPFLSQQEAETECSIVNHTACRFSIEGILRPDDPVEWADPLCPGGEHTIWPTMLEEDCRD